MLSPRQHWPPFAGGGLVQVLLRSFIPPPHFTLHSLQSPKSLHPPSTIAERKLFKWTGNNSYLHRGLRLRIWSLGQNGGEHIVRICMKLYSEYWYRKKMTVTIMQTLLHVYYHFLSISIFAIKLQTNPYNPFWPSDYILPPRPPLVALTIFQFYRKKYYFRLY